MYEKKDVSPVKATYLLVFGQILAIYLFPVSSTRLTTSGELGKTAHITTCESSATLEIGKPRTAEVLDSILYLLNFLCCFGARAHQTILNINFILLYEL